MKQTHMKVENLARVCCYWADPLKNGTCHDNYCCGECRAIKPEQQFFDMAENILKNIPSENAYSDKSMT